MGTHAEHIPHPCGQQTKADYQRIEPKNPYAKKSTTCDKTIEPETSNRKCNNQADKGKTIVIINYEEYSNKIHTFFMTNNFCTLPRSPTDISETYA
jgi:hypothetical protein